MQRERVTHDIYVFTSSLYARVTAGAVITTAGAVLIDTLLYPEETYEIKRFLEGRLGVEVRYVINTHYHADHTVGTWMFPNSQVIAHRRCRDLLDQRGRISLERLRLASDELHDAELILPTMVFDDRLSLKLGNKTIDLWSVPGHSPDGAACYVEEDNVLFAGDAIMALPYFVDGDFDDTISSLKRLRNHSFESIVQGHGEVILRGEVDAKIQGDLNYLYRLSAAVDKAMASKSWEHALSRITLESCGKERILLNGAAEQLHEQNVQALVARRQKSTVLATDAYTDMNHG